MNQPVRQHTVPKFSLRNFSFDNRAIFELRNDKPNWFKNDLTNASVHNNIYAFTDSEGNKDYSVEKALSKLETAASPIVQKVDRSGVGILNAREKHALATFIAVQYYRTKKMKHVTEAAFERFKNLPENKIRFAEENRAVFRRDHGYSDRDVDEYIKRVEKCEDNTDQLDFYVKSIMFSVSRTLLDLIFSMNWRTERIKNGSQSLFFITSDTPFAIRNRGKLTENQNIGLQEERAEFYFPISCWTMLIGSHDRLDSRKNLTQFRVNELNKITMVNRHMSIFAPIPCPHNLSLLNGLNGFRIPDMKPGF